MPIRMIGGASLIQDIPQDIPNVIRYEDVCDVALIGHGSPAVGAPKSDVIPGRCEASNPESRDSESGPSDHPGMT
jgi:hypothetical protein